MLKTLAILVVTVGFLLGLVFITDPAPTADPAASAAPAADADAAAPREPRASSDATPVGQAAPEAAPSDAQVAPAVPAPPQAMRPEPGPAAVHLALARQLLEENRDTALGSTRAGLNEAEEQVRAAIRLGGPELPQAWRLLAEVLAEQGEWGGQLSDGRPSFKEQEREALRRVLDDNPSDVPARVRYAELLDDQGARLGELERAVRDGPRDVPAHRALAVALLDGGRVDEGARLALEAAEMADREQLRIYGPDLVRALKRHGRQDEAARVSARMEALGR